MATLGGTVLNYGQQNSQNSLSGLPQQGLGTMAQGSTNVPTSNPGPAVQNTQFNQSLSNKETCMGYLAHLIIQNENSYERV
jgi:hypothetical protein